MQRLPPAQSLVERRFRPRDPKLAQRLWHLEFGSPIGLAAGFDKDAVAVSALAALGFGFLEVGTVTPRPQAGNPRPRLFRFPDSGALQNAMGFNNAGMVKMGRRLASRRHRFGFPVGINIGKNKDTPLAEAATDYIELVSHLKSHCDYFVVNVSSPNTPGLRDLQQRETLAEILKALVDLTNRPLLVKLSPDLEDSVAVELAGAAVAAGAVGIVLTNTTTDYSLLPEAQPFGGLSGRVLRKRSFELLRVVASELFGRCTLISVGGVECASGVYARLRAGASLVQLYTAFVYGGPDTARWLNEGMVELLERDGVRSVEEVIGVDV
jgi:dihydroorotate dehydrogenase